MMDYQEFEQAAEVAASFFPPFGPGGCEKVITKNAEADVEVEIKPNVTVGKIETVCCGEPMVICEDCDDKLKLVVKQRFMIKVPICYKFIACVGETEVSCGKDHKCK